MHRRTLYKRLQNRPWRIRVVFEPDPVPLGTGAHVLAAHIIARAQQDGSDDGAPGLTEGGWEGQYGIPFRGSPPDPNDR